MAYSRLIKGILVALVLSFLSDYLWHTVLLADFYNARFIAINGVPMSTDFPPFIALFELIGAVVLTYFVLGAACKGTVGEGFFHGALLGLLVGTGINFVAHSLIPKWDLTMALVDSGWAIVTTGIIGAAVAAVAGKKIA